MPNYKINVWGDPNCDACKTTDEYFKKKTNIKYKKYDLTNPFTAAILGVKYPDFKNDKSVPIIQKCVLDDNNKVKSCTFTQGFKKSDYE